jgi:hypothetical protein
VEEIDTRAFDPSLWDATPVPEVAELPDAGPAVRKKPAATAEEDEPDAEEAVRRQAFLMTLTTAAVGFGLVLLVALFALLRRL